jgi:hypothetical protein
VSSGYVSRTRFGKDRLKSLKGLFPEPNRMLKILDSNCLKDS